MHVSEHFTNYWRVANEQRLVNGTTSSLEFDEAVTEFHEFRSKYVAYVDSQRTLLHHETERNLLQQYVWKLSNLHGIRHSFHETREPLWHLPKFERPDPVSESILGSLVHVSSSKAHKHFWNLLGAACLLGAASRLRELQGSRFLLNEWMKATSPYVSFFRDFAALRDLDLEFHHPSAYGLPPDTSILAKLLRHVPSVHSLQLSFAAPINSHGYLRSNFSLDAILSEGSHWDHLTRLSLHAFATTESYLRVFCRPMQTLFSPSSLGMPFPPPKRRRRRKSGLLDRVLPVSEQTHAPQTSQVPSNVDKLRRRDMLLSLS